MSSSDYRNRRGLRTLLRLRSSPSSFVDQNPLISPIKKKAFASAAFRSLSCSSYTASQAHSPTSAAATVRTSADWEENRLRRRRSKQKKKDRASAAVDVWCAPGISFVGNDSVDCVVSQRNVIDGRSGRVEVDRDFRERTYYGRRGNLELASSISESVSTLRASLFGNELTPSEHYHHLRRYYNQPPVELEEIMLMHHRLLLHGDIYDCYRDWRLDVDHMTYEELLELGDRIGHVSTGLREEEIACNIRKMKHSVYDKVFSVVEMERKCSICQEEYEMDDEVGRLECGHSYHIYCIREWLLQKNACPVCKKAVSKA